jgi:hypothetical protein
MKISTIFYIYFLAQMMARNSNTDCYTNDTRISKKNSGTNDLQHKITYFWCKQISPDQKCVKAQFVIQEK